MRKLATAFLLAVLLTSSVAVAEMGPEFLPPLTPPLSNKFALVGYQQAPTGKPLRFLVPFPWSCGGAFVMSKTFIACYNYPSLHYYAGAF